MLIQNFQLRGGGEENLKPAQWTGDVIIRFSNFSNDGLKLDTCIVLAHDFKNFEHITKLSGHFEDGKLQVSLNVTIFIPQKNKDNMYILI